jgi:glutamate synthase domain-containing protein 3
MTIMDMIRNWNDKKKEKSEKFKKMQEDYRLNKMLEERQKSANERELDRYMKEQREEQIKSELTKIRNKKNKDSWKGNILSGRYMFENDKPILKEKNIFIDHRNDVPLTKKGDMFFKW